MKLSLEKKQQLKEHQEHMDTYQFSYDTIKELTLSKEFLNLKPGDTLETPQLGAGVFISYSNRPHIDSHIDKEFVEISLTGHRMDTFAISNKCVCCGVLGNTFKPTIARGNKEEWTAHLNLYTEEGIMMTMDHILPKSLGGKTEANNLITCCKQCNEFKGSTKLSWKKIRKIILSTKGYSSKLPLVSFSPELLKDIYSRVKSVKISGVNYEN